MLAARNFVKTILPILYYTNTKLFLGQPSGVCLVFCFQNIFYSIYNRARHKSFEHTADLRHHDELQKVFNIIDCSG